MEIQHLNNALQGQNFNKNPTSNSLNLLPIEKEIAQAFKGERLGNANPVLLSANLSYCAQMVGCVSPTKEQFLIVEDLIKTYYKAFTIDEMKLAFKMNITGDFGEVIEHYQNFSPDYFAKVMTAYRNKANQVRGLVKVQEPELPVPELDPLDIIEYSFQEWRNSNKNFERLFNGVRVFELIHELGLKNWTKEDGHAARKNLNNLIEFKANKMNLVDAKQYRETWTDEWLKMMGKNIAVAMWFEELITNGKETLK